MRERITGWMHLIPEGTGDLVILLIQLFVVLALIGWAYNRGFRAMERGPIVRLPLLTVAFGLALVVRHLHSELWQTLLVAAAVVVAGFFGRNTGGRGIGVPMVLIATLLGLGFVLSAYVLALVAFLAYFLSPVPRR
ncbi:MAG: hypothetical protein JST38_20005 [Bacteroidetes bacterium]|nr:hypothetical protein [Bacteroidota bacterium]MBS1943155.1 hypothetical protein [Bacteroidota bacterium]